MRKSLSAVLILMGVSACTKSATPTQPSSPIESDNAAATASVTVPRPLTPAAGALVPNADQPLTLTVANAVVTQGASATYTFEVATDAAFSSKAFARSGVAPGANGQTSVTIDRLAAGADYFWRARAEGGGTAGPFTAPRKVTIGPAIVINAVTGVESPRPGSATGSLVTFAVTNAVATGPVGTLSYRFDISTSSTFSPLVASGTVTQGASRTTFSPAIEMPAEMTLYWRVTVSDQANGITGPASEPFSFNTALAIDLSRVVYLNSPNVSTWPRTATLRVVEQDGAGDGPVCMDYSDPGWPDSHWPFGGDDPNFGVYANQWYFAKINGIWYGGAGEWIYRGGGSCKAGQGTRTIGPDSGFGPPFSGWVPKVGELVGFMVSSVARNGPVRRTVDERSNVIVQPWRDTGLGSTRMPVVVRR
jgi:hypothetical protein